MKIAPMDDRLDVLRDIPLHITKQDRNTIEDRKLSVAFQVGALNEALEDMEVGFLQDAFYYQWTVGDATLVQADRANRSKRLE